MSSKVEYFLEKTLGQDFMESLEKVELWKPGTKSTIDHEEIRTALQIVPRTIMALLIRELAPMSIGENKVVHLFVAGNAVLNVTKHERDVYSGDILHDNKIATEFKFRSLPGVGLIVMSAFELYDMDNLINSPSLQPTAPVPADNVSDKVQRMIDERLALHDLVGKVVDKKIMEKEAIHQLVLVRLTEALKTIDEHKRTITELAKISESSTAPNPSEYHRGMTNGIKVVESVVNKKEPKFLEAPKKKRPLEDFLEKRKQKAEYSIVMAKGETVDCPDCRKNIFDGAVFSGCICLGDDMTKKVFIKKSEEGIKVRFSKGWDEENIEMLLEVLRKKHV